MRRKNGLRLPPKWGIPQVPGTRKVLEFVFIGPPSCPKLEKARHAERSGERGKPAILGRPDAPSQSKSLYLTPMPPG